MSRDFWNARYGEEGFAYGDQPNDFLRSVAARIPSGPVLCLAEGQGRNAVFLAGLGHAVTAVDLSAVGLARARAFAASRGLTLETLEADLSTWVAPEARFSGVVATFAHLPPPARAHMLASAVRSLVPGGVLIFEAYTPRQLAFRTGGPPEVELLVEPEDLRRELSGLRFEVLEEVEREVVEGRYHTGRAAVVRALAVK